ncbi:MAG: FadR family transcriptional regulator [Anaerolineales bacterium]|nr:FadR family transcriptional regulator [Anaerolineales bacterium]
MSRKPLPSEFLQYLAAHENGATDPDRLPSLEELSAEISVSIPKLREQMEVARQWGLVEARPRTGIRRKPYTFSVTPTLLYAVTLNPTHFNAFSELRTQLEAAFWCQAVAALTPEDHTELQNCITLAWEKLNGTPIRIPHPEHRTLHLTIFARLDNPFVRGLLEAYWEAYEAVELDSYADYTYLREVWSYHQRMVEAIVQGNLEASKQAFIEHTGLLRHRPH